MSDGGACCDWDGVWADGLAHPRVVHYSDSWGAVGVDSFGPAKKQGGKATLGAQRGKSRLGMASSPERRIKVRLRPRGELTHFTLDANMPLCPVSPQSFKNLAPLRVAYLA